MQFTHKFVVITLVALALSLSLSPWAHAHLMVAQHGTLNIVDDGAFMVLSLPVSGFKGVDDDNDGKLSVAEFSNHRAAIANTVRRNVTLSDRNGSRPLEGIMLAPVVAHDVLNEPASQLNVMGRFSLAGTNSVLRFHNGLYGKQSSEQSLEITATRKSDNQKHVFELTPASSEGVLFADELGE